MRISKKTIETLSFVIQESFPENLALIKFFNRFGANETYRADFPPASIYVVEKINALNGSNTIAKVIEKALDARNYHKNSLEAKASMLNERLLEDGYQIVQDKRPRHYTRTIRTIEEAAAENRNPTDFELYYRVQPLHNDTIDIKAKAFACFSHEFIAEQIKKANNKLTGGDYDGAITNARSLTEAIQEWFLCDAGKEVPEYNGDLLKLYKATKQALNLDPSQQASLQIFSGLHSTISGLAGLSNQMADRHARTYKPDKRHAKLAINAAFTFCEFLLDTVDSQK
jgi:hypothetical protein